MSRRKIRPLHQLAARCQPSELFLARSSVKSSLNGVGLRNEVNDVEGITHLAGRSIGEVALRVFAC